MECAPGHILEAHVICIRQCSIHHHSGDEYGSNKHSGGCNDHACGRNDDRPTYRGGHDNTRFGSCDNDFLHNTIENIAASTAYDSQADRDTRCDHNILSTCPQGPNSIRGAGF